MIIEREYMKIIGITGGIGCGKSEVLKYLESLGAYIVETDKLAHALMKKGEKVHKRIIDEFGADIIAENGEIDRERFGQVVFNDESALIKLNSIVHPAVKEYIIHDIDVKRDERKTTPNKCGEKNPNNTICF